VPGTDSQRPDDTLHGCSGHPNIPAFSTDSILSRNPALPFRSFLRNRFPSFNIDDKALDAVALTSALTLDTAME
jgi:hypothetical protein